jgi:hypothetical protein
MGLRIDAKNTASGIRNSSPENRSRVQTRLRQSFPPSLKLWRERLTRVPGCAAKGPQEHVPTALARRTSTHAARTLFLLRYNQRLMRHLVFPQQLGAVFAEIGPVALARVRNITHHSFPGDPVELVRILEVVLDVFGNLAMATGLRSGPATGRFQRTMVTSQILTVDGGFSAQLKKRSVISNQ